MESIRVSGESWPGVEVSYASGFLERLRGIKGVPAGRGIALRKRAIHTFGLSEALSAFGVDGAGTVVTVKTLRPNRLFYFRRSHLIFELREGEDLPLPGTTVWISRA
jgi:hypothetical protein